MRGRRRSGRRLPNTFSSLARCSRCGAFSHPPDIACPHCGSTDPAFAFTPVDGTGTIRSWTVIRQSFLPGFDVPFVLVDVELQAQPDLRMIGRLMDGPDAAISVGAAVSLVFEDIAAGSVCAGVRIVDEPMSGRMEASNQVAIVGYAQSPVTRHADQTLGGLTVETARRAIADAGLTVAQVDGFVTASLFPSAGAHAGEDGVSSGLGQLAGRTSRGQPQLRRRISGLRPDSRRGVDGGQRRDEWGRRLCAGAPCAPQPAGQLPREPDAGAHGSQQWTVPQGYFGPLAMIALAYNEYLQRYGATREAMAAVVSEARKNGARIPWSYWFENPLEAETTSRPP